MCMSHDFTVFGKIIPEHVDHCNNLPTGSAMPCFAYPVPSFCFLQNSGSGLTVSIPFSLQLNLSMAAHCFTWLLRPSIVALSSLLLITFYFTLLPSWCSSYYDEPSHGFYPSTSFPGQPLLLFLSWAEISFQGYIFWAPRRGQICSLLVKLYPLMRWSELYFK